MRFDDVAIAVLLIVVGAVRVVPQILDAGTWDGEVTLACGFIAAGALTLFTELRRPAHDAELP